MSNLLNNYKKFETLQTCIKKDINVSTTQAIVATVTSMAHRGRGLFFFFLWRPSLWGLRTVRFQPFPRALQARSWTTVLCIKCCSGDEQLKIGMKSKQISCYTILKPSVGNNKKRKNKK